MEKKHCDWCNRKVTVDFFHPDANGGACDHCVEMMDLYKCRVCGNWEHPVDAYAIVKGDVSCTCAKCFDKE